MFLDRNLKPHDLWPLAVRQSKLVISLVERIFQVETLNYITTTFYFLSKLLYYLLRPLLNRDIYSITANINYLRYAAGLQVCIAILL